MSQKPAKRPRLESFSPPSPPYHLAAKPAEQTKHIVQPNTPTSPPYMSSASHPNGTYATTKFAASAEITPPSSVHISQHGSQQPNPAANSLPVPTPTSMTGAIIALNSDNDGDVVMAEDGSGDGLRSGVTLKSGLFEHRRSDHDRKDRGIRRKDDIFGEIGAHGDALYRLCQRPHPMSRPHGNDNLITMFGLDDLAASVARTSASGEKINKLRKSYEGITKSFQVAGKPKAAKMENVFTNLLAMPDEEYMQQRVVMKEMDKGFPSDLKRILGQALSMAPGPLPNSDAAHYRGYLASDDSVKSKGSDEAISRKPGQPAPAARTSSAPSPAIKAARPERAGAKRRYNDNSFVGYSEGFGEDAESTAGEDDARGGLPKKKRKKEFSASSPFGVKRPGPPLELGDDARPKKKRF